MNTKTVINAAVAGAGTLLLSTGGLLVSGGKTWEGLAVIIVGLAAYAVYELIP